MANSQFLPYTKVGIHRLFLGRGSRLENKYLDQQKYGPIANGASENLLIGNGTNPNVKTRVQEIVNTLRKRKEG